MLGNLLSSHAGQSKNSILTGPVNSLRSLSHLLCMFLGCLWSIDITFSLWTPHKYVICFLMDFGMFSCALVCST